MGLWRGSQLEDMPLGETAKFKQVMDVNHLLDLL